MTPSARSGKVQWECPGGAPGAGGKEGVTNDSVTLTIDGEVRASGLARIVAALADLLDGIGASLSADSRESPCWEIAEMKRPEPDLTVTTLRRAGGDAEDGRAAAAALVAGVRSLGERLERPPSFSDKALQRVQHISYLLAAADRAEIAVARYSGEPDRAIVIPRAAANAHALSRGDGDAAAGYEEYGSTEGPAETLDARGEPYFTVRDALAGIAVRCYFGEREREEAGRAVAGKRIVSVEGMLHRDREGRTPGSTPRTRSPRSTSRRRGIWIPSLASSAVSATRRRTCGTSVAGETGGDGEPDAANPGLVYLDSNVYTDYLSGDKDWNDALHDIFERGGAAISSWLRPP